MVVGEIVEKPIFHWVISIETFDGKKAGDFIKSPVFFKSQLQLVLYPKGQTTDEKDNLSLYLKHLGRDDVVMSFSLTLLYKDNEIVYATKALDQVFKKEESYGYTMFVAENFIVDSKNNILRDNKLTIMCEVISIEHMIYIEQNTKDQSLSRLKNVLNCFEELLTNIEFSDVTITAKDKKFYLHKCILSIRSPVFKLMFENDMKEKNQGLVEITDIKSEILQELFQFIYSGKVNNMKKVVCELLIAAEKYCVEDLKEFCEETMCKNLTIENTVEYLNLAISTNAEKLKAYAIKWMSVHLDILCKKSEFDEFVKQHPELSLLIMKKHFSI